MKSELFTAYFQGFTMMASLIVAIGLQNAFVLRQGVKHQDVFLTVTICFLCDALLISIGAAGLGALFSSSHILALVISFGGCAFLVAYAIRALHAAKKTKGLDLKSAEKVSRANIILASFAVSLLNPHAILDTIVLVGGLAARYEDTARYMCALGAITASCIWFYSIGYGAKKLAPFLSKPKIWRIVDLIIGLMMLVLAFSFAKNGIQLLYS